MEKDPRKYFGVIHMVARSLIPGSSELERCNSQLTLSLVQATQQHARILPEKPNLRCITLHYMI